MTCGSLRSGIASSGTRRMTSTAPTNAIADSRMTSTRRMAHHSMILAIMPASVLVGRRVAASRWDDTLARLRVAVHAGDGRLQAALGVDQERRAGDHRVAGGEPAQHGDAVTVAAAGPHPARLVAAVAAGE